MGARARVSSSWGQNETPDTTKGKESQPSKSTHIKNQQQKDTQNYTIHLVATLRDEDGGRAEGLGSRRQETASRKLEFCGLLLLFLPNLSWSRLALWAKEQY